MFTTTAKSVVMAAVFLGEDDAHQKVVVALGGSGSGVNATATFTKLDT